jgi:tRNA A-37 threonylcarbamoyl transferase component Bud32/chromate transport protein ChrA
MGSSSEASPAVAEEFDDDLIDLEPTHTYAAHPSQGDSALIATMALPGRPSAPVAIVEGNIGGSLAGETNDLRRTRLAAAGLFLAIAAAVLWLWSVLYRLDRSSWVTPVTLGLRSLIAALVSGLLMSLAELTARQVRWIEYFLFGSFTLLISINQYLVGLDLLRQGDIPGSILFIKNGVFGVFVVMVIYGMFIPNDPRITAEVVLSMSLAMVIVLVLVMEHPQVAGAVESLRTIDHAGSNILILAIGAALSIYGSYLLNGLRLELHEAQKFGQYRLLRKIGSGGMGEVYLAEHQLLKRPCALKLIRPEAGANPVSLARFEREVRSAARLSHPNSIEIYDYGHAEDGTFYYVMEFLPGMSLQQLITKFGPLPPGRAIYLLRQACAGLAEAHALGLVHRDLKPANLFIANRGGESDVTKVLDFGLVKLTKDAGVDALTADFTVSGTPAFMPPEQATASRDLDTRADVYAMGAVAYYVLTGQPPFTGDTAFAIMMAHARDPVTPPSELRPEIPADLESVILKSLAKKPEDRYPDAREMGRALAACEAARDWDADKADLWWAEQQKGS